MVEAEHHFVVGCSSGEPSSPSGEADGSSLAGSSDELLSYSGKADGPCDVGTSSVELVASLGKVDDPSSVGISLVESSFSLGKSDELSSVGTSFGEPMVFSSKADLVFPRPLVECFLSVFLSFLKAGLVVLGDQEGDDGGLVSLTPIAALDSEQPRLVELPTKALCVVPRVSV